MCVREHLHLTCATTSCAPGPSTASLLNPPATTSDADSGDDTSLERLKVVVRIRPETTHDEYAATRRARCIERTSPSCVRVTRDGTVAAGALFDRVFDGVEHGSQGDVYESVRGHVRSVVAGRNATILAHGHKGGGKSYTMLGIRLAGGARGGGCRGGGGERWEGGVEMSAGRNGSGGGEEERDGGGDGGGGGGESASDDDGFPSRPPTTSATSTPAPTASAHHTPVPPPRPQQGWQAPMYSSVGPSRGIVVRAAEDLLALAAERRERTPPSSGCSVRIHASYVELRGGDRVHDLLTAFSGGVGPNAQRGSGCTGPLDVLEDAAGAVTVADATRVAVTSLEDVIAAVRHGAWELDGGGDGGGGSRRRTSHTVLTFTVEHESRGRWGRGPPRVRRSKLNLVTLADYELGGVVGGVGVHAPHLATQTEKAALAAGSFGSSEERTASASLAALGICLLQVASAGGGGGAVGGGLGGGRAGEKRGPINYRETKLTRLLADSLGGGTGGVGGGSHAVFIVSAGVPSPCPCRFADAVGALRVAAAVRCACHASAAREDLELAVARGASMPRGELLRLQEVHYVAQRGGVGLAGSGDTSRGTAGADGGSEADWIDWVETGGPGTGLGTTSLDRLEAELAKARREERRAKEDVGECGGGSGVEALRRGHTNTHHRRRGHTSSSMSSQMTRSRAGANDFSSGPPPPLRGCSLRRASTGSRFSSYIVNLFPSQTQHLHRLTSSSPALAALAALAAPARLTVRGSRSFAPTKRPWTAKTISAGRPVRPYSATLVEPPIAGLTDCARNRAGAGSGNGGSFTADIIFTHTYQSQSSGGGARGATLSLSPLARPGRLSGDGLSSQLNVKAGPPNPGPPNSPPNPALSEQVISRRTKQAFEAAEAAKHAQGGWNAGASLDVAGMGSDATPVKLPPLSRVNPFAAKVKLLSAQAGKKTAVARGAGNTSKVSGAEPQPGFSSGKPLPGLPHSGIDGQGVGEPPTPPQSSHSSEQEDRRPTLSQQQHSASTEEVLKRKPSQLPPRRQSLSGAADASTSMAAARPKDKKDDSGKKAAFR